jgi:predicted adenine nucleotide alpha hydrolase (AANH) superfamily ATPase
MSRLVTDEKSARADYSSRNNIGLEKIQKASWTIDWREREYNEELDWMSEVRGKLKEGKGLKRLDVST